MSCGFFIGSIFYFLNQSDRLPFIAPTDGGATTYTLRLSFRNEVFGFELSRKEGEEDGFLVKGFDGRKGDTLGAFDELVCLRHVEDEFVADEFGGSVVGVGTKEGLSAFTLRSRQR